MTSRPIQSISIHRINLSTVLCVRLTLGTLSLIGVIPLLDENVILGYSLNYRVI